MKGLATSPLVIGRTGDSRRSCERRSAGVNRKERTLAAGDRAREPAVGSVHRLAERVDVEPRRSGGVVLAEPLDRQPLERPVGVKASDDLVDTVDEAPHA